MMRAEAKSQVRMETSVPASRFALPFLQKWLPAQAWSPVLLRVMQAWSTVEARSPVWLLLLPCCFLLLIRHRVQARTQVLLRVLLAWSTTVEAKQQVCLLLLLLILHRAAAPILRTRAWMNLLPSDLLP